MKYEIIQKFISHNRPGTPLFARGAVIHETANPNDSDEMEQKYFDTGDRGASAHAFIDNDSITQCIAWTEVAWHAGRTANRQFWGIEMCHTDDPYKFSEILTRTVWLFAHLFVNVAYPAIYTVTPFNLLSHAEVSEAWKETDHTDPVDYFTQHGKTVYLFRQAVQDEINNMLFNKTVSCNKIVSTPDYWVKNCAPGLKINGAWARIIIKNYVAMFIFCNTFDECIDYLFKNGIVKDVVGWKTNTVDGGMVDGGNMRWLLINMAKNL